MLIRKWILLSLAVMAVLTSAESSSAQTACGDTFPWTVTGTNIPGGVVVNSCGHWAGCFPHDPSATVSGDQIQIMFLAGGEIPGCSQCTASNYPFSQDVFISSLPAGTYAVTVAVFYCGQQHPQVVGTGTIVSAGEGGPLVVYGAGIAGAWTTELTLANAAAEESSIAITDRLIAPCVPGASCASLVTLPPRGTAVATYPLPGIGTDVGAAYIFPGHGPNPSVLARAVAPGTACATVDLPVFGLTSLRSVNAAELVFAGARHGEAGRSNLLLANVPDPTGGSFGPSLQLAIEAFSAEGVSLGQTTTTVEYGTTVFVRDILGALGVFEVENAQLHVTKTGGGGVLWGIMPISRSDGSFSVSVGAVP
ncbi:MAG TPA: hypothetical protein VGK26_13645 [Thermoanaerobaculia bacterium]|jgi:hypothetical protein